MFAKTHIFRLQIVPFSSAYLDMLPQNARFSLEIYAFYSNMKSWPGSKNFLHDLRFQSVRFPVLFGILSSENRVRDAIG